MRFPGLAHSLTCNVAAAYAAAAAGGAVSATSAGVAVPAAAGTGAGAPAPGGTGVGAPAPGGTGTPPPPTIVKVGGSSAVLEGRSYIVGVGDRISCPKGTTPCLVTVVATSRKSKSSKKQVVIGRASFKVAPGTTHRVTFKLNATGTNLLGTHLKLTAKVSITVKYGSAAPVTGTRTITLVRPKRHKRHR